MFGFIIACACFNQSRGHMHPLKTFALLFVQVSKLFQAVLSSSGLKDELR